MEEYLNKSRPNLKDINSPKKSDTQILQLTIAINFISSKNTDEERVMHSKSDKRECVIYDNADEVMKNLFASLLNRYHVRLETSMRGSDFLFDCIIYFIINVIK